MMSRPSANDITITFTYIYIYLLFIYLFIGYLKTLSAAQAVGLYRRSVGPLAIVKDGERSFSGFVENTIRQRVNQAIC